MDRKELDNQQRKANEKFNSITGKSKTENQNQTHNVRKEGITPINQKRQGGHCAAFLCVNAKPYVWKMPSELTALEMRSVQASYECESGASAAEGTATGTQQSFSICYCEYVTVNNVNSNLELTS